MPRLVLASNNPGKLRELQDLLADTRIEVVPQNHFHLASVEETGLSFVENALLKARHAARHTGLPALADDSGLAVDALNGAPGIYSARFAGERATETDNIHKLLDHLKGVADPDRAACFHCAIVLCRHATDPVPLIAQGSWRGSILHAPTSGGGFGYDPIFHVPTHNRSAAELDPGEKNRISHRARAIKRLREMLEH
ncbi:MAG: RdgB/HAM1 family non-canonical purine NTP pyrophosphatase [Myxococcota bacterium]